VCGLGSLTKAQIRPLIVSSLADAPNRLSGYVFGSNPYGITLDCAWIAWAAEEKVSETVAAAVLLICQNRPGHEVVAKLTPWEFERVVDIVRRSPGHFPFGTLAALKSRDPIPARLPAADSVQADQAPRRSSRPETGKERNSIGNDALKASRNVAAERPAACAPAGTAANHPLRRHRRASGALGLRTEPAGLAERANREGFFKHTGTANAEKAGTHPGTLVDILRRRMVVEDLSGLGLSIRGIAAATGIPRSSVHRAVRAMARARAKQEADAIEIMKRLLGKRLSRQGEHSRG